MRYFPELAEMDELRAPLDEDTKVYWVLTAGSISS